MPASLSEAFGENYDSYPPGDNQIKRRKKPAKPKNYGQQIPTQRFTQPEPQKQLNINLDPYPQEENFLSITNEYGPTDYNIKPTDVQEYAFQMNNNYNDNITNKNIQNHQMKQNLKDPNLVDETDNEDEYTYTQSPTNNPNSSLNSYQTSNPNSSLNSYQTSNPSSNPNNPSSNEIDPRIADFNAKLDLILQKLGHFDEPKQENIHDIILFVIFGCFVIFILDSVYRVGKMTL